MNNNFEALKNKKLFVLDMDGTFYLGNRLFEGSLDFIAKIRATGREFLFFTNNASKTPEFYIKKLEGMGCAIVRKNIATAGDVTIKYLLENRSAKRVYLVGTELLESSFKASGINLVQENPDIVVTSFDTTLTYEKLSKACKYIREGAEFMATHMDINCPTEDGFIPDSGAICALITASTGVKPRFFGKPFSETVDIISSMTGYSKDEMAIIGDRLYTDIALGYKNGVTSILVLSGETKESDISASDIVPDFVFPRLADMIGLL